MWQLWIQSKESKWLKHAQESKTWGQKRLAGYFFFCSFDNDHQKVWTFNCFLQLAPLMVSNAESSTWYCIFNWTHWYSGKIDSHVYWASKVTIIHFSSVIFVTWNISYLILSNLLADKKWTFFHVWWLGVKIHKSLV